MRSAVFHATFKMLQPAPSIFFQHDIILKRHVIVLHFENTVNYAVNKAVM